VHSFTQSAIGPTILAFLAAGLLFSVALLALRIDRLTAEDRIGETRSREGMFLVNNLLFVLFTFTVLVGTVFPLIVEALRGVQMSVGRPYFDRMSVPIGVALLLLTGVGPALPWGRATGQEMRRALLPPLGGAAVAAALGYAFGARHGWTLAALAFGGYTAFVTLRELWRPVQQRHARGEPLPRAAGEALAGRGRRRSAAYVAHAGAVIVVVAIAVSSTMGTSREVQLQQGESFSLGRYTLTFLGVQQVKEPHREALVANVAVYRDGRNLGVLSPRMNQYPTQREPIGTPAVRSSLREDLYLSIMNVDAARGTLGLLALVNPMVAWIWIATAVTALGGLLALLPRRRARVATVTATAPAVPPSAAAAN